MKNYAALKWKDAISGFPVSPGSAEAVVSWGGKIKYILIAYFLGNICAKNCRNRTVYVKIIASCKGGTFLSFWDTVYIWGAHWHHLANTTEPSMCGGDSALCQITLTTCYIHHRNHFLLRISTAAKRDLQSMELYIVLEAIAASVQSSCADRWITEPKTSFDDAGRGRMANRLRGRSRQRQTSAAGNSHGMGLAMKSQVGLR